MAVLFVVGCGGNTPADSATTNLVANTAARQNGVQLVSNPAAQLGGTVRDNVLIPDSTRPQGAGMMNTHLLFLNGRSKNQPAAFSGWSPAQLRSCYGITGNGSGTVVIVDAFDDTTALA